VELFEEEAHLSNAENDGEAPRATRSDQTVETLDLLTEYVSVEEEQRAQRLVLGRGTDCSLGREEGEKPADLPGAQLDRMAD
jgi:hypothetical protein